MKPTEEQLNTKLREGLATYNTVLVQIEEDQRRLAETAPKNKKRIKEAISQRRKVLKTLKKTITNISKELDTIHRSSKRAD